MAVQVQATRSSDNYHKGFLNKIKNDKDQTIGYLFGTIHNIPTDPPPLLQNRIIKCLKQCQTLWLEVWLEDNSIYEKELIEYFQSKLDNSQTSDQDFDEPRKVNFWKNLNEIFSEDPNVIPAEGLLAIKAHSLGIIIKGLETRQSRWAAAQAVKKEEKSLSNKLDFLAIHFVWQATKELEAAVKKIECTDSNNNDTDTDFESNLAKGYESLVYFVLNINLGIKEYNQIVSLFIQLIDKYEIVFNKFNLDSHILTLKKLFISKTKEYEYINPRLYQAWKSESKEKIQEAYKIQNPAEVIAQKINWKKTHLRDLFMVEQINNNLLESTQVKRSFFAIGCGHLLDDYDNAQKLLEKKGWRIVNAYKE